MVKFLILLSLLLASCRQDPSSSIVKASVAVDPDDTCGIQSQLDSIPHGGIVSLPAGPCFLRRPLVMKSFQTLRGVSPVTTDVFYTGAEPVIVHSAGQRASMVRIEDIGFTSNVQTSQMVGIDMTGWYWSELHRVVIGPKSPSYSGPDIPIMLSDWTDGDPPVRIGCGINVISHCSLGCQLDRSNAVYRIKPGTRGIHVGLRQPGSTTTGRCNAIRVVSTRAAGCEIGVNYEAGNQSQFNTMLVESGCMVAKMGAATADITFENLRGEGICTGLHMYGAGTQVFGASIGSYSFHDHINQVGIRGCEGTPGCHQPWNTWPGSARNYGVISGIIHGQE